VRSGNAKKRKFSDLQDSDTKRLISNNTTATPCAATGLRGLYNMGQTCFMSVILQSLIHNPIIRTFYLAEGHRKEDCEREACTSCALDDIFTDFFGQEKHEGYGAVHMLQGCWKGGGGLAGYSQQDAHEYLGFILNSLHSANTADDDDSQGNITQPKDAAARDCTCVIHQTFGGLLKSTVTCSTCKNTTTALDPFMDLSLDIRNSATAIRQKKLKLINGTSTTKEILPMDLMECLDRFTSAETLSAEGGNYHCRTCGSAQEAKKKLSLVRLPPVVPIHLKRFRHEKTLATSSKVETKIRFPLTLDLTPYAASSSSKSKGDSALPNGTAAVNNSNSKPADEDDWIRPDAIYELSSVVVHKGKIDNGHYVSYSRQGEDWFRFDDSMVVQVDEKEAMGCEAYMLFYVIRDLEG
jgi:ubiquitin carboxyl-terminal hydrolase 22/27/51